jgi:hypothetical protein
MQQIVQLVCPGQHNLSSKTSSSHSAGRKFVSSDSVRWPHAGADMASRWPSAQYFSAADELVGACNQHQFARMWPRVRSLRGLRGLRCSVSQRGNAMYAWQRKPHRAVCLFVCLSQHSRSPHPVTQATAPAAHEPMPRVLLRRVAMPCATRLLSFWRGRVR